MATRAKTWGDFKRWCENRGLKPLPAHPWTIAAYLRWVERRHDAAMAREALNVISREHLFKSARVPGRHPTVQSTLALIERRAQTRGLQSNLFDDTPLSPAPQAAPPEPEEETEAGGKSKRRTLASSPRLVRRRTR